TTEPLREENLHAWTRSADPHVLRGPADYSLDLHMEFNREIGKFFINGESFVPPTLPVLLQILSGAHDAQDLLPTKSIFTLPPNKVVEISLPGAGLDTGGP
ncbi:hypothetical protein H0H93_004162, partial [Arthromyces matolae]